MIRGGDDQASPPKYARVERERRWRVDPARRPPVAGIAFVTIVDRYLTDTRLRLRRMVAADGRGEVMKLTKKYPADDPLARAIVTAYLDPVKYGVFAALPGRVLEKRRYPMPHDGLVYSLDIFDGPLTGLELLEIEADDDAALRRLHAPGWTIGEVSDDPRYQGGSLCRTGPNGRAEGVKWPIS